MAKVKRMHEVYSSGDVTVTVKDNYDINPSAIEYNSNYAHEYQRGLRRDARGWRMGAKEMDAKITLPLDAIALIEKGAPNGDIALYRPFPIIVTFLNSENEMIKDIITAKFKGNGRTVTNDGEIEKEYELFPTEMKFNV
ncbi:MAG: hypothetical protein ABIP27_16630 [Flavobacterium circumlabens]|uniref:hypothetical protein n=1 Tax=Flavobacterium circumlabens TaxID=2133765 RepID=UPI0032644415